MRTLLARAAVLAVLSPLTAHALTSCRLDGQPIDLDDGRATAGRTGMVHCVDADGVALRDIELRDGKRMGTMRYFQKGVLVKEYVANERGNVDGFSRLYAGTPGPKNQLVREETARNGTTIGVTRTWYPDGTLQRLAYFGDDGQEHASAGFTAQGRLSALRCFTRPVFAPDADDAAWCGFRKAPVTVDFYSPKEVVAAHVTWDHGERRRIENLWDNGKPQQVVDLGDTAGTEHDFTEDGKPSKDLAWIVRPPSTPGQPGPRVVTLQKDYHESGTLVRERRWTPTDRGADLALDQSWYLNGQLQAKDEFTQQDGHAVRHGSTFHDNGKLASTGTWVRLSQYDERATGASQSFDENGRLRAETLYDAAGHVAREREFDESGQPVRDDQVFEDGSRKAYAK